MTIKTAEILCVGTEILIGDIVNTNAAFLSAEFAALGITQHYQGVVGDNEKRLVGAIKQALTRCDLLVITGGLGPTYDDITKETVAKLTGRRLIKSEEVSAQIAGYFKKLGRTMTQNNEKQAYIIEDALVLGNDWGTAPGMLVEDDNKIIVLLPGPPSEMKPMWIERARPVIAERCDSVLVSKNVNIIGIGEAAVAEKLDSLMQSSLNPTVAPYCKPAEVRLRVTASAKTKEEAESLCDEKVEEIRQSEVGKYIYGIDTDVPSALIGHLIENNLRISTAESCTGGLIAKMITDVPGASEVFEGSVVTYSNRIKNKLIGVSEKALKAYGAVSHQVAARMVKGVCELTNSEVGIAVTGIAGPGGGTAEKPVGTVYIAVNYRGKIAVNKYQFNPNYDRERIRSLTAIHALQDALRMLKSVEE